MRTCLLLLLFLLTATVHAFHGGTIRGMVTNLQGEPLVGASVFLVEQQLFVVTDQIGVFVFSDLANGEYKLQVSYIGHESLQKTVQVSNHETSIIQINLIEKRIDLEDVEVRADQSNPLQTISQLDIRLRPIQSSQDILRAMPGLFIAQHAGGGKAEQIFLRGFDIDHGTDIALFADGIPVNMVSHAHGQGYADLHFLIPELVQKIDFEKGMYDARTGNFATAGQVRFETPRVLDQNFIRLEAGQFDTYRMASAINLLGKSSAAKGANAYIAGEQLFSNAYFE
ncbi:MAG: TonB-dependent receptor, partial [Saprospiraceae bacterium]|nr:TonB-dependent receptor [Saprospiraceae bacterium]